MRHFILYFKRNIYFMISIITLFIAVVFAGTMFFVNDISNPPSSTTLGSVYLGAYEEDQYDNVINNEITAYIDGAVFEISYQDSMFDIPLSLFEYNHEQTMSSIIDNQVNQAYFSISDENKVILEQQLELNFSNRVYSVVNVDDLMSQIIEDMGHMTSLKQYQLADYFVEDTNQSVLNQVTVRNISVADVSQINQLVDQIIITPNSRYSILENLATLDLTNVQLSVISTGLLEVLAKSHINGFMFNSNPLIPSWATIGYNVRILRINQYDFSFFNSFEYTYYVNIEQTGQTSLSFTLTGVPFVNEYNVEIENKIIIPRDTIYYENDLLDEFTPNIIIEDAEFETTYLLLLQDGYDGSIYYINRSVTDVFGTTNQYKLYEVQYNAQSRIYEQFVVEKGGI
ncbi:hypothetical protein [Mariniplasma anaerobium]|uniref:Uncharacterized protein n=1 Tax=Mariniplasma anaerobium TaxID=2735436 RepID=A0A7U9TGN2_9MOLU|nr:hypothetical protein [Mariniplasma anaerobium]BCR35578.1 hypothetical protein MPAN_004710 [Mariniplasma anaerobium]